MKPQANRNFPIQVSEERPKNDNYAGIYSVDLNSSITVHFVPYFSREDKWWLSSNPHLISAEETPNHARIQTVLMVKFVITPDDRSAGQIQQLPREALEYSRQQMLKDSDAEFVDHIISKWTPPILFFVTPNEFELFQTELKKLTRSFYSYENLPRLSDLRSYASINFITNHVLDPAYIPTATLKMLGLPDT